MAEKAIVAKLDEYVSSLLEDTYDEESNQSHKKKKKRRNETHRILEQLNEDYRVKKPVVKMEAVEDKNEKVKKCKSDHKLKGRKKHLEMIKEVVNFGPSQDSSCRLPADMGEKSKDRTEQLDSQLKDSKHTVNASPSSVPTVGGSSKRSSVEVVVFEQNGRKRKGNLRSPDASMDGLSSEDNNVNQFNMKRARYEVQKFGIKGFEKADKEKAQEAIAIKLGAKPHKKKCVNYKVYMEDIKAKNKADIEKRELDRKFGFKVRNSRGGAKNSKSNSRRDLKSVDGQIGKYRGGVLLLKKEELEKIKKTRVKK